MLLPLAKVLLINTGAGASSDSCPVGIAVIAAVLERDGFTVKVADLPAGDNLDEMFNVFNPECVGLTATTQAAPEAYAIADLVRKQGVYTVIGGVHAGIMPQEALEHADCVVQGEGELVISDIFKNRMRGICIGKPVRNLDDSPMPAYHLLNMPYYTSLLQRVWMCFAAIAPSNYKIGTMLTSRGCPWDCSFCHNSFKTLPYRFNSTERVMAEIKVLTDTYGINALFFVEDNFFANQKRLKEICECLKRERYDLVWGANSRVNNVNRDILQLVKSVGCKQVTFGWESASQRILDILNKRTTVDMNYKSITLCDEAGINSAGTVMVGNPTETEEDLAITRRFINDSPIAGGVGVCLTTPYPGTKLWDWCLEQKLIPPTPNYQELDFHHIPVNMSAVPSPRLIEIFNDFVSIAVTKYRSMQAVRNRRFA